MIIECIKKYQLNVQKAGGTYMGRTIECVLFAAEWKDKIGIGKTMSEAINNCLK